MKLIKYKFYKNKFNKKNLIALLYIFYEQCTRCLSIIFIVEKHLTQLVHLTFKRDCTGGGSISCFVFSCRIRFCFVPNESPQTVHKCGFSLV